MSRKTVLWIMAGVLAAAVVATVGIISYHVGFNHGAGGSVANLRGPMRGPFGIVIARRGGAFPGIGLFLALLAAGGIGALIVYLAGPGRRPAPTAVSGPGAAPGGGAYDPRWQQFEEWHRYAHNPAGPGWAPGPADPAAAGTSAVPVASGAPAPNAPVAPADGPPAAPDKSSTSAAATAATPSDLPAPSSDPAMSPSDAPTAPTS